MKDFERKLARLCGEAGRTILSIDDEKERKHASKIFALMLATYVPNCMVEAYKKAINELPFVLKDETTITLIARSLMKGIEKDD